MARLAVYGAISTALAGGVIASAFAQRSNFYAACIYLYKSNACLMIILNLGLFLTIIAGHLVQIIFFGNLRTLEVEHLYERAWYAVTETCLAMTIFKDEFDTRFVVMFTVLLFLKVFHWLCQDRVESMEQSPEIPLSFHVRMVTMIAILVTLDVLLVLHSVELVRLKGPNMMIMFGFEYTLLATSLLASFGKYVLHTIDLRSEEPWENKSMLLFYLDLVADFVKLVTYLLFFMVILVCYGLPLHIIRDVYMTMRSFLQKCKDLIQYRKATRNMNERYPDASPADLAALSDPICIICREEMVDHQHQHTPAAAAADAGAETGAETDTPARPATPRSSGSNTNVPKKLPCGHIFHFHCLKSWLERQQSCPTCRRLVLDPPTPAPTPVPQVPGDAAQGAGAPGAAHPTGVQQHGNLHPAGNHPAPDNANNNNAPAPPALGLGQNPVPYHGMGFTVLAPQGQYPLTGWHPQMMNGGALPGAFYPEGAQAGTGATAGTTAATGGATGTAGTGAGAGLGAGAAGGGRGHPIPNYLLPHVSHPIPGFIPLFPVGAMPEVHPHNIWAAHAPAGQSGNSASSSQQQQQQQGLGSGSGSGSAAGSEAGGISTGGGASGSRPTTRSSTTPPTQTPLSGSAAILGSGNGSRLTTDQIPLTSLDALSDEQLQYLEENTRRGLQERLRILQAVESQIAESVGVLNRVLGAMPPAGTPFRSDTADPPSPVFGSAASTTTPPPLSSSTATEASAGSGTTASSASSSSPSSSRSWAFGAGTSQVGLQSSLVGRGVHGLGSSSMATATATCQERHEGGGGVAAESQASEAEVLLASSSSSSPSPVPSSIGLSTGDDPVNRLSGQAAVGDDGGLVGGDRKGKAKKTEEELALEQEEEQKALAEAAGNHLLGVEADQDQDQDQDEDEEDAQCSPQEMVRRRWAQKDVSSARPQQS
ncbi:E3 ubiquitin-protein ligase hrd1 [Mortierella alpina]|nr:E3 ubiquitin-protein ligase hrd1 [Mortierella alpina]